ncbi:MAG: leucine-rich repeat domain-containing protein [Erysipelotrichaceae bacterium]|nr:leucine-rich repeat domain-containing protein [Erysipelotrichaceae bacterium]
MLYNDFLYELDQDTKEITLTKYIGKDSKVTIPDYIDDYPVTRIDEKCFCRRHVFDFSYKYTIQSFYVSDNHPAFLTHDGALYDKTGQTLIRYPNIEKRCIYLPHDVITISKYAFESCKSIQKIYLSQDVEYIGNHAFDNCPIKTLILPKNLKSINNSLISRYTSFQSFIADKDNPYYTTIDGVLYNKDLTHLIAYPRNKENQSYIVHEKVQYIDDYAFYKNCYIKEILLMDHIKSIGHKAFFDCRKLACINLPDSITTIGYYAFYNCQSLKEVILPENIQFIEDGLFWDCQQLKSVIMSDSVLYINDYAFSGCHNLQTIRLSSHLKRIGDTVFYECQSLRNIDIPSSVQYMSSNAFKECNEIVFNVKPYSYAYKYVLRKGWIK